MRCLDGQGRGRFQAGQREAARHLYAHRGGLVCLDVSQNKGVDAFPGGPKAHLYAWLYALAPSSSQARRVR